MAIVTISRGTLSGGTDLAHCVGTRLGYQVVSREDLVVQTSRLYGIKETNLVKGLGRGPSLLDRFRIDRKIYLEAARATLCRLALPDDIVYHGHAGQLLFGGVRHLVRVRIVAPVEHRVSVARREMNFSQREAEDYIREMDEDRRSWTRFLYGVEWDDPRLYDVTINLEKVCCDAGCEIVSLLASNPDFAARYEDRRNLENLFLASHVKALLYLNPKIAAAADGIEVEANDGEVRLKGLVPSSVLVDEVIRTAEDLPEVKGLDAEWLGARELSR